MDYATLKFIWWLLVGVLLIGFAIMDGHDMGVGTLLPFVGKTDTERRVVINTIGPHWEGNQVWFITGGGAIFAAWPLVYAAAFSGFYWAMMAVLWALFFRPVGFDYRSKLKSPVWRSWWDRLLFIGSAVPPLIFGVAFGNLLQGVPFYYDDTLRSFYTGSFWALLNPFALLCGLVSTAMITFHGANYLMLRTEDIIFQRAKKMAVIFGVLTVALFALAGIWLYLGNISGFVVVSGLDPNAVSNPLVKTVAIQSGAWFINYTKYPFTVVFPVLGLVAALLGVVFAIKEKAGLAVIASSLAMVGIIVTAAAAMFPFVMPSSSHPNSSLTAWDGTSSLFTLQVMLVASVIFVPLIVFYTRWAYKVLWGKVTEADIRANDHSAY
ncbi:cytochrome d ubiquinol oxidase subunit II [Neisseria sp. Ec49-e6-T10]|uniref:cytochrome d ubiquinol oxidase subunit II n=1 Tax=Neisseria sp. Ec49-e6-T10 TaxID=3140744 RepID=UPI003EB922AA